MYYSVILKCLEFNQFFHLEEIIYFCMIPSEKNEKSKKTMRGDGNSKQTEPLPQRPLLVPSFCRCKTKCESFFIHDENVDIYA